MEYEELKKTIRRLSKSQREALAFICVNQDMSAHPRSAVALVNQGLVVHRKETLPGRFAVIINRYEVASVRVHMAWCEVCSEEKKTPDDEETPRERMGLKIPGPMTLAEARQILKGRLQMGNPRHIEAVSLVELAGDHLTEHGDGSLTADLLRNKQKLNRA